MFFLFVIDKSRDFMETKQWFGEEVWEYRLNHNIALTKSPKHKSENINQNIQTEFR
jgi:hypothetical protein